VHAYPAGGRNETAAGGIRVHVGKANRDLGPRQPFPRAEIEFAPTRFDFERNGRRSSGEDDLGGRASALEVASDRALEGLVAQRSAERLGLRPPDVVECYIAAALKALLRIPGRSSVAHDDEVERTQVVLSASAACRANSGASAAYVAS
jgi:hypothetical protein